MLSSLFQRGFTIVELLVGVTLLGVLLGIGVPTMGTYLQNSKLANVAASYFTGMQIARTEAIRRNVRTEFVLTDTAVSTADIANVRGRRTSGRNWVVRAASGATFGVVEVKAGAEGDGNAGAAAIQVSGSASAPAVFDGRIAFNGFGGTVEERLTRSTSPIPPRARASERRQDSLPPNHGIARRPDHRVRSGWHRQETAVGADSVACAFAGRLLSHRGDGRDPDLRARHPRLGRDGRHRGVVAVRRAVPDRGRAASRTPSPARWRSASIGRTMPTRRRRSSTSRIRRIPRRRRTARCRRARLRAPIDAAWRRRGSAFDRAANLGPGVGLPGATAANQQIYVDGAGKFNRVVITLCWQTASDDAWRRHTLVTYVN